MGMCWQHRNEVLHKLEQNQQDIVEDDINQQIQQVYEQDMHQLPQVARQFMKWPLQQLLWLLAPYKHQWIAALVAVRNQVQYQMASQYSQLGLFTNQYISWLANQL